MKSKTDTENNTHSPAVILALFSAAAGALVGFCLGLLV